MRLTWCLLLLTIILGPTHSRAHAPSPSTTILRCDQKGTRIKRMFRDLSQSSMRNPGSLNTENASVVPGCIVMNKIAAHIAVPSLSLEEHARTRPGCMQGSIVSMLKDISASVMAIRLPNSTQAGASSPERTNATSTPLPGPGLSLTNGTATIALSRNSFLRQRHEAHDTTLFMNASDPEDKTPEGLLADATSLLSKRRHRGKKLLIVGQQDNVSEARANRVAADITEHNEAQSLIREEICMRRIKSDISAGVSSQVLAQTVTNALNKIATESAAEAAHKETTGIMGEVFDAIGAPLCEAIGYVLGLFLLAFVGKGFMDKIVMTLAKMIPGAIDVVMVPLVSDMACQTITRSVEYAVTDATVPAICTTMKVQIMACLTAYMAMTIGPQLQHKISHGASQAIIREVNRKVTHHVVEGITHSVTHVALHKVIHQFLCIYCYYHGQYCEKCFYYGEAIPFVQNSGIEPKSYGPFGTNENGAFADLYNQITHIAGPINPGAWSLEMRHENKARAELEKHQKQEKLPNMGANAKKTLQQQMGTVRGID